jgi:hypothetical protein
LSPIAALGCAVISDSAGTEPNLPQLFGPRHWSNIGDVDVATRLGEMHQLLSDQHYDVRPLVLEPPATSRQIADVELALGMELPTAFGEVPLTLSSHTEFQWFAGDRQFARPFHQNFSGDLHWSLDLVVQFETQRRQWCAVAFPNPADPYDSVCTTSWPSTK